MQRYFIHSLLQVGQKVHLSEEDNHHLSRVMRAKLGDKIECVAADQTLFLGQVCDMLDKSQLVIEIMEAIDSPTTDFPFKVHMACGLSKNDKLDWIVQKATELGMTDFTPLSLTRDVVKWQGNKSLDKVSRLQKIADNASQQSKRLMLPKVHELQTLMAFIEETRDYDLKIVAFEESAKGLHQGQGALKSALKSHPNLDSIACVSGSEGGLTLEEVASLEKVGFIACSLGPRILRAETAPLYFLSALSYHYDL